MQQIILPPQLPRHIDDPKYQEYNELGNQSFLGVDIKFTVTGESNPKLLLFIEQRIKKLKGVSYRNNRAWIKETVRVDFATLKAAAVKHNGHLNWQGSTLAFTLHPTERVDLMIQSPAISIRTDSITKPSDLK